jgi:glycosyltransferase involved in cell wall biosynthesis
VNVCFAVLHYDPTVAGNSPLDYLDQVPIHRHMPSEVARLGHSVTVVYLYPPDHSVLIDGVQHEFVSPGSLARAISATAVSGSRRDRALYEPAWRAIERIRRLRPDILHFHGMTLTWNLALLLATLPSQTPIVLHYHGGHMAQHPLARAVQSRCFRRANAFLFTTREHGQPFVDGGSLDANRVVELDETSSSFAFRSRNEARIKTGMAGNPVFVWTGRLDPIKDPFTALRGFELIVQTWPDAQLYLYYSTDQLLPELRAFVDDRPGLARLVHFRGKASGHEMEDIYNSADFFLQASQREVCGGAALEAMACGVIPVITNIPSFRAITDNGVYGVLFPTGDAVALADRTLALQLADVPRLSREIREHFDRNLSFPALAGQLDQIYRRLTVPAEASRDQAGAR